MNRTDRYIAAGALAISVGLLAAPAAGGVPDDSGTDTSQVEYRKLLTLVDPSAPSSQLTKARVDHLERQAMASEQGAPAPSDAGDSSTPVSAWQLALSALAAALLGGSAVAASRLRRNKTPDSEPEHQETVAV